MLGHIADTLFNLRQRFASTFLEFERHWCEWDLNELLFWISNVESEKFIKITKNTLESVWKIENMKGHLLKYVNRDDLRSWGIKEFE